MKCVNCGKELTGKQARHCSDRCRMALKRTDNKVEPEREQPEPEQVLPEQDNPNSPDFPYELVEGEKVYGRQAVRYFFAEAWDTRPEPLNQDDEPKPRTEASTSGLITLSTCSMFMAMSMNVMAQTAGLSDHV